MYYYLLFLALVYLFSTSLSPVDVYRVLLNRRGTQGSRREWQDIILSAGGH